MFVRRVAPLILALLSPALALAAEPVAKDTFDYAPNPAVWRLSDGDATIYMFGTIHALPPQLKWRSPALERIIGEVDELVLETVNKEDEKTDFLDDQMVEVMLAGIDRKPLLDRVVPANRAVLDQVVKELNISMDYLDLLPTWMVAFELFYSGASLDGVSPDYGVETVLEGVFGKANKPVSGIEDAKAVNAALNRLSEAEQLIALDQILTEIRTAPATSLLPDKVDGEVPFADDIAWAQGDISKTGEAMTPATMGQAYYEALLVNRNAAWTEWLANRLDRPGTILLAVGSAHLAGKDSVQTMLAKKGLTVERIH
jgi:uncharacterized protein YbaP (TraB family)